MAINSKLFKIIFLIYEINAFTGVFKKLSTNIISRKFDNISSEN